MKKVFLICLFILSHGLHAQNKSASDIEIVESVPIGTTLDNLDIRNTQEVWLEMIRSATRSIDFEEFYISNEPGKLLEDVIASILDAANRGVKVRFLVDSKMYKTYPETVDSLGRNPNIETRTINFGAIAGGIQHSKYFIVDGKEVFVGSQNFDWRSLEHIHELGLRIGNKEVAEVYGDIFNLDWRLAADSAAPSKEALPAAKKFPLPIHIALADGKDAVITPTCSPAGWIPDSTLWDERAIVDLINGAKKSLMLQFLSYSTSVWRSKETYTVIDDAIRNAAKRGVHVRMIVSDWEKGSSSSRAVIELSAIPNIETAFTSIPEWSGGYVSYARVEHCKYIVADDSTFWLGTANCEKSYFYSTRNLGIVGISPELSSTLSGIFMKSWNSPYKELITPGGIYQTRKHGEIK